MLWSLLLLAAGIRFDVKPTGIALDPPGPGALRVFVGDSDQAILGAQAGSAFVPRFPFTPGVAYRAVWMPPKGTPVTHRFTLPQASTPRATVEQIFPTANLLPENQLKFYLHFSAPMSRGEAYRHIQLRDRRGEAVALPFLELDEELWDRAARRLTIFFDPGRIKRGLVPHNEAGAALVAGQHYTLAVDAAWPDASGQPLARGFTKSFTAGPADRTAPTLDSWKLTPPAPGSRGPLIIDFPEPMDRALLERMIRIAGVAGLVAVEREETRWLFTPRLPWRAGTYEIEVDAILEDLAGNKFNRLFDVDVFEKVDKQVVPETVRLRFTLQ